MGIKCQRNDELKDEELRRIIDFNINDSHIMSKAPRVAKPMSYFGLMAGTETNPSVTDRHRKVGITQLLQDLTLREADLSASAARDISFFTAVIRTSLYVRLKARSDDRRPFQCILFDGKHDLRSLFACVTLTP